MNDFVEVRQILATTLRWWWLLLVAMIGGLLLGYMASRWQAPVYAATTTLLVGQSIQSADLDTRDISTSERLALTYANMARLQPVLQAVVENLSLNTNWQTLKAGVRARPVEETKLLRITVESHSPESAETIANELANTLIAFSPSGPQPQNEDANQRFVVQRLDQLRNNIVDGQEKIDALKTSLRGANAEQAMEIQNEINMLEVSIIGWENNYTRLLALVEEQNSSNRLSIVEPAQAGLEPIRPRTLLNMIIMAAVGLALALGTIFLLENLRNAEQVTDTSEEFLGLPVLGTISTVPVEQTERRVRAPRSSPLLREHATVRSSGFRVWWQHLHPIVRRIYGVVLIIIVATGVAFLWTVSVASSDEFTTEFNVLGPDGRPVALPLEARAGEEMQVTIALANKGRRNRSYRMEVWAQEPGSERRQLVAVVGLFHLPVGASRQWTVRWRMPWEGDNQIADIQLYRVPAGDGFARAMLLSNLLLPTREAAAQQSYRNLRLWINVLSPTATSTAPVQSVESVVGPRSDGIRFARIQPIWVSAEHTALFESPSVEAPVLALASRNSRFFATAVSHDGRWLLVCCAAVQEKETSTAWIPRIHVRFMSQAS